MATQIILIGDSIRMGYQDRVKECVKDWAQVWAPQENGRTTENVLEHLDEWIIARQPDMIHLNCGLHDLRKEFGATDAAVPLDVYTENIRTILNRIESECQATLIWALTTPVNEAWHHENKNFDRFEADVRAYNAAATGVCEAWGVTTNDLYTVVNQAGRDKLLVKDGVHFNPKGRELLGDAVVDCIWHGNILLHKHLLVMEFLAY